MSPPPEGVIFGVQRFSVDDGPGIRTTVFLKGCTMHCSWCHNPESWRSSPEVLRTPDKCMSCGRCAEVCTHGAFQTPGGVLEQRHAECAGCASCVSECPAGALRLCGTKQTADVLLAQVEKDRRYYAASGGGLTVSGGEPTCQPAFMLDLAARAAKAGLHVAIETNGIGARETYADLLRHAPLVLLDYKMTDPADHKRYTGADRTAVLETLDYLLSKGAHVVLRCPVVPGINDNTQHFQEIARLSNMSSNLLGFELMAYHAMGLNKAHQLGMRMHEYPKVPAGQAAAWREIVLAAGGKEWDSHDR